MTTLRNLAASSALSVLGQLYPLAVGLVLTPFLIHRLGLDRFGIFSLALAMTSFLVSFDGGISSSAGRFFGLFAGADDRDTTGRYALTLCALATALGCVASLLLWLAAPPLLHAFGVREELVAQSEFLLRSLGPILALSLIRNVLASVVQARQRYGWTSASTIVSFSFYAVGMVVALNRGGGLRAVAVVFFVQSLSGVFVLTLPVKRLLTFGAGWHCSWHELSEFARYAGQAQLVGLTALVNLEADSLITGLVLGVRKVGLYSVGANVAMQLRGVPLSALPPIATALAHSQAGDGGRVRSQFAHLQRMWVTIALGWSTAAAACAYFGIIAWLGPQFRPSAIVASVLLIGHAVNLLTGSLTSYLQVVGRPDLEARYGLLGMIVNVVLTVPLTFAFGLYGLVAATSAGQVVGSAYLLRLVRTRHDATAPRFVDDIRWVAVGMLLLIVVGLELALDPLGVTGVPGLFVCALPGLLGLLWYALVAIRPLLGSTREALA